MLLDTILRKTLLILSLAACSLLAMHSSFAELSSVGGQYLEQDTGMMPDASEFGDAFGAAVAHGDFNCDGYQDLAVGVPEEDVSGVNDAGQVTVIFGSPTGLDPATGTFLSQSGAVAGVLGMDHRFGAALAAGNFDADTSPEGLPCDDLAIGVPGMVVAGNAAGAVVVLPGTAGGFSLPGSSFFARGAFTFDGTDGDAFGAALAVGDFNTDGYHDLAVGSPGENISGEDDAGRIFAIGGSAFGLSPADSPFLQFFSQSVFGAAVEAGDRFGSVLVAGDFDRQAGATFDDLVVGIPDEDVGTPEGTAEDAGAIIAIYGSGGGLTNVDSQIFTQSFAELGVNALPFNRFGAALAAADFDGDTVDDLAIGSPGVQETLDPGDGFGITLNDVGLVHVIHGIAGAELTHLGHAVLRRSSLLAEFAEGDEFGYSLAAADFNRDGFADLGIGVPGATAGGISGAGIVHVLRGYPNPSVFEIGPTLFQDGQALGLAETGDAFGWALTAGDFDGVGGPDLAVGVPIEEPESGFNGAGAVNVFYSLELFADGFESGDLAAWSAVSN